MHESVAQFISGLTVAEPMVFENMAVFGIKSGSENRIDYITLQDALDRRLIEIAEKGESGSVPELLVCNPSEYRVLLIQGEGLVGAKQNRILNASILIGAHSDVVIPVSCVEQGRWSYKSRRFAKGESSHSRLRAMTCKFTTDSLKHDGSYHSDQSRAWGEIKRKLTLFCSMSDTQAMHDVYHDHSRSLGEYVEAFGKPDNWHGMAVAINEELVGVDVFHGPDTMDEHYAGLLRSYALDALESKRTHQEKGSVRAEDLTDALSNLASATPQEFKSPGLGQDIRFRDNGGIGSALVYKDTVLHFAFFRMPDT